jgi:aspartate/methionine/tyrosine aminotransferase
MRASSVYMRWAKEHAAARYNLANSGLLGCTTADLPFPPGDLLGDLLINGPNGDGYPPLKEAIAARYGVATEQVVLGEGTSGANFLAFSALVAPGDEVLVEQPTYEPLLAALSFLGARVRRFARRFADGYRPDLSELREAISERTRLVVLTNPHNPTGVLLSPEEMAEIGRLAATAGALVLVDEVYLDTWFEAAPPSHVHLGPQFLATSSLTKAYGLSGLRCGWVLAHPDLADRIRRTYDIMAAAGSMPGQSLAVAAFRQLPRFAARGREILEPNLALVHAFLAEHAEWLECVVPERSIMVFPRLRKEEESDSLHERLRRRETSIVPGKYFEEPRHFRLGFAVKTEDVACGLENLGRALREG